MWAEIQKTAGSIPACQKETKEQFLGAPTICIPACKTDSHKHPETPNLNINST